MAKRIVLGTAGHVDHGKTSLVKALTGTDTDRLAEEKRRGITIELGFAHLPLPDGTVVGVVDVPGHERFVKSMVAGAFGLDLALLVVAMDEGVMPQTREHLEICSLLGVKAGLVALNKSDLAPTLGADLVQMVRADLADALRGSFLEEAPVIPVSARTGEGLEELKAAIARLASTVEERPIDGPPFLPIDRAFTIRGFGTVVTGTLLSGSIRPDDEVTLYPQGRPGVRVRGVQAYGKSTPSVAAGMRAAVNLSGVEVADVKRGMVLGPAGAKAVRMLDVELELLEAAPKALATRSKVLLHLGTDVAPATVTLLDRKALEPGDTAPVQLTLGQEVAALAGQRFIVRGFRAVAGRGQTLGGGVVLDTGPRRHRHRKPEAAALLQTLRAGAPEERLQALLVDSGFAGARLAELAARVNLTAKVAERSLNLLLTRGSAVLFDKADRSAIARAPFEALCERAEGVVRAFAARHELSGGISREELRTQLTDEASPRLLGRVLEELVKQKKLEVDGDLVRSPGSKPTSQGSKDGLLTGVMAALTRAGLAPPRVSEVADQLKSTLPQVQDALRLLRAEGRVVRVRDDMYFDAAAMDALRTRVVAYLKQNREMDIQAFKELVGQTRKWTVPLGEYFDQERLTLRVGEKRVLRGESG